MDTILGIVINKPVYITNTNGNYLILFSTLIDRAKCNTGKILVLFKSKDQINFRAGYRLEIRGKLIKKNNYLLQASSIKVLPKYNHHISL